jgi:hypothetical protein
MRLSAAALTLPLFALTLLAPSQAQAQVDDARWVKRVLRYECLEDGICYRRYYYQRRVYRERQAYYPRRTPQVRGYIRREDDEPQTGWCRDTKRVVGSQHLTISGAKNEADKAWIQTIRFHYGEVFMDMSNAKDVKYTCSRSSVGETLGQTFNRCEIEARPCKAPPIQSAEEK